MTVALFDFAGPLRRFLAQLRRYRRDTKAAAAVEFALTLPFFVIFILLMMELALFFFASSTVEQGVFNYSRKLVATTRMGKTSIRRNQLKKEIQTFVGGGLIAAVQFELGPVTDATNFKNPVKTDVLGDYVADKTKPFYLRVVATRRTFTYEMFKPVWNIVCDPAHGGLFSDIDVLVVTPWPPIDQS